MKNKQVDWKEGVDKSPKWVQAVLAGIGYIIKLPNFIWNIPGLSKLKGIRMIVLSVLVAINEALAGMDIQMMSGAACKVAELFNKICDPNTFVLWYNIITGWLIAALAVEDKSDNKGGTWFSGLFKKK